MARQAKLLVYQEIYVQPCWIPNSKEKKEEEVYPNRYDNVDIQAVLQNDELREEYYKCFMGIEPCKTPEQTTLTAIFSEAYQTKCKKCTEKQKEMMDMVADWYTKNDPEKWQLIVAKTVEDMKKKNAN